MNPTDSRYILLDITYKYANPNGFNFMHRLFTERKNLCVLCVYVFQKKRHTTSKPITLTKADFGLFLLIYLSHFVELDINTFECMTKSGQMTNYAFQGVARMLKFVTALAIHLIKCAAKAYCLRRSCPPA